MTFLVVIACIAQAPRSCWADDTASDVATAESLFHEARALLERGEHERACRAFEASLRLERAVGTLLNLARCYELTGRIATAWSTFAEAEGEAQRAQQDKRAALARQHKQRLAPRVPRVVISMVGGSSGVEVQLDGKPLGPGALGLPLAIDPGRHAVRVEKVGYEPFTREIDVSVLLVDDAPPLMVEVGPLVPLPQPAPDESTERRPVAVGGATPAPPRESRLVLLGGIATGVGLAGVGVGIGLGLHAVNQAESADCDENLRCSPEGLVQRGDAQSLLTIGYVVGIASGVVAAAGITLLAISLSESVEVRADVTDAAWLGLRAVGAF